MIIRELRVRYEVPTAMGRTVIHAVVCRFPALGVHVRGIKEAGLKLIGVDERFREESRWQELDEGWTEIARTKNN